MEQMNGMIKLLKSGVTGITLSFQIKEFLCFDSITFGVCGVFYDEITKS